MILADETGCIVGPVDDAHPRVGRKEHVQPFGKIAGDEVADHQNRLGVGCLGCDDDFGLCDGRLSG